MARQRLKPVQLKCKHFVLVPSYQSSKPEDYQNAYCYKCDIDSKSGKKK